MTGCGYILPANVPSGQLETSYDSHVFFYSSCNGDRPNAFVGVVVLVLVVVVAAVAVAVEVAVKICCTRERVQHVNPSFDRRSVARPWGCGCSGVTTCTTHASVTTNSYLLKSCHEPYSRFGAFVGRYLI